MSCHDEPGSLAVAEERVEIDLGPGHIERLATIVDPLLVPDLSTVVWAPHGHTDAVDALTGALVWKAKVQVCAYPRRT